MSVLTFLVKNEFTNFLSKHKKTFLLFTISILCVLSKGSYVLSSEQNLDSDQAIPLLMAKRILELREFPFFYWGQNYMGLFEVWLSLPLLFLFGLTISVFTCVEIIFCIALSYYLYWIFLKANEERPGIFLSVFFAIGHPNLNSHLVNVSENYSSSLFFAFSGFLIVILLFRKINSAKLHLGIGLVFGLAFYNREILILVLPWAFAVYFTDWKILLKKIHFFLFGFSIGYIPAILHYLTTPHHKKLIRPTLHFSDNILSNVNYLEGKFLTSIFISGIEFYSFTILFLSLYGIFMLFKEKNEIVKKIFLYYLFGALTCLFVLISSKSFSVERYYFYAQILPLFFGSYGFSKLFYRQKLIFLLVITILALSFGFQTFKEWQNSYNLSIKNPSAKFIAEKLKEKNLKHGFCEYWAGLTVSYFSDDEVFCLIYFDKQSDFYSAYKVIQNRAEFYLFRKNSELENYFLNDKIKKNVYEKVESGNLNLYISQSPTLDLLESNRDALLKELSAFGK